MPNNRLLFDPSQFFANIPQAPKKKKSDPLQGILSGIVGMAKKGGFGAPAQKPRFGKMMKPPVAGASLPQRFVGGQVSKGASIVSRGMKPTPQFKPAPMPEIKFGKVKCGQRFDGTFG